MLTGAILAIAAVLGVIAFRSENPTVQITLTICCLVAVMAFFAAVVLVIKILGPYALLSGTQIMAHWKMGVATKGVPNPPDSPVIHNPAGAPPQLELPPASPEQ
jgi:hypothetical protein